MVDVHVLCTTFCEVKLIDCHGLIFSFVWENVYYVK